MKGLELQRGTVCGFSIVALVAVILIAILVPLSFTYIERNTMGFRRTQATNNIELNVVYHNGRYQWGLGKTAVTFPANFVKVSLTDSNRLSVFTETGQTLTFESVFFYRLIPSALQQLYVTFGTNYHLRVVAVARAALRNAAANLRMDQYMNDRANITNILYQALSTQLLTTAFVNVPRTHFSLLGVVLPSVVVQQKTLLFLNTQQVQTNNYTFQSSQIRLDTKQTVLSIENAASLVAQQATATVTRLVQQANARAFQAVQTETGTQLQNMISMLGVTNNDTAAAKLIELNTILDAAANMTIVRGITQASIVQLP